MIQAKEKNRSFRQTKKLIRIALEDGWTQTEIAKKARVQQSVVSGWANGKNKAQYQQIEFLLEQYGHRLRKLSSSIYSTQRYYYEMTPELSAFLESKDVDPKPFQDMSKVFDRDLDKLPENNRSRVKEELRAKFKAIIYEDITQVEAPIIFRSAFQNEFVVGKQKKKYTVAKWVLHSLGGGHFLLVIQARRMLSDQQVKAENERRKLLSQMGYKVTIPEYTFKGLEQADRYIQTCNDDAAHWNSRLLKFSELGQMLEHIEGLLSGSGYLYSQYDLVTLPFLLKKALLDAGFPIKGVRKITAY